MYSKLLCMFLYIVGLERSGAAAVALSCLFGGASASREKIVIGGVLSVFLSRVVRTITTTITITEGSCVFIDSECEFIERASF